MQTTVIITPNSCNTNLIHSRNLNESVIENIILNSCTSLVLTPYLWRGFCKSWIYLCGQPSNTAQPMHRSLLFRTFPRKSCCPRKLIDLQQLNPLRFCCVDPKVARLFAFQVFRCIAALLPRMVLQRPSHATAVSSSPKSPLTDAANLLQRTSLGLLRAVFGLGKPWLRAQEILSGFSHRIRVSQHRYGAHGLQQRPLQRPPIVYFHGGGWVLVTKVYLL